MPNTPASGQPGCRNTRNLRSHLLTRLQTELLQGVLVCPACDPGLLPIERATLGDCEDPLDRRDLCCRSCFILIVDREPELFVVEGQIELQMDLFTCRGVDAIVLGNRISAVVL
jgi:hypothetical protein